MLNFVFVISELDTTKLRYRNNRIDKSASLKCSAWEGPGPGIISLV
jgi:hypothetical protein